MNVPGIWKVVHQIDKVIVFVMIYIILNVH